VREIHHLGTGWTLCISPGPHQYVFFSNSNPNGNPPGSWENTGEIYEAEIDGTVIGRFGKPVKNTPGVQVGDKIDVPQPHHPPRGAGLPQKTPCRKPNELILGEIESWRVQKYLRGQTAGRPAAGR